MRVLLVESDARAAANLKAYLAAEGAHVEATNTGEDALDLLRHYEFDVMVLNLALADMDGTTVISRTRAARNDTPVLALSASPNPQPRVKAFAAGADDVVAQSIDREELLARLRAIVRRSWGYSQPAVQFGNLTLNLERREVSVDARQVHLTAKEFAILHALILRKNMVLSKETLLNQLYNGMDEPDAKIIDVFVCKIRSKLAKAGAPNVIGTVWGRGYTVRDAAMDGPAPLAPQAPEPVQQRRSTALSLA